MVLDVNQMVASDAKAAANLRRWRDDPIAFVREVFGAEPDAWQADGLRAVARDPRVAMSACKGPGKSCLLAWSIWWFLATRVDSQIFAVSITAANLRDGLWKELAFWRRKSPFLEAAFTQYRERITSNERPETWWCSARGFAQDANPEAQANTLAGLHAKHVMIVLDEVGEYPQGVLVAAEGIFANVGVDAHVLVAGNPTSVTGPLYRICTKDAQLWTVIHITGDPLDAKRSTRIPIKWAQEQIDQWGRESAFVMVNVLGLFPPAGSTQLIPINLIIQAQARAASAVSYRSDPRIWGLDPARYGDDASCLARRQGIVAWRFLLWRDQDGPMLATRVGECLIDAEKAGKFPDALFIDVGGIGSSCYDHLVLLGWGSIIHPIDFGGSPSDRKYLNKRSEMWMDMAYWFKVKPANLPTDPTIADELTGPTFEYKTSNKRTCFALETKQQMRKRGIKSPNKGDALALTFAAPVSTKSKAHTRHASACARAATEYDTYAPHGQAVTEYDSYNQGGGNSPTQRYRDPLS